MLASKKVKVLLIMDFNYDANINIITAVRRNFTTA